MGWIVFLLFVSVPIVEIGLFISIGGRIGLWPTLGAIVATAAIGAAMLRHQGLQTLARARDALDENRPPVAEVFEGACLVFAGALLLTPGFMTDSIGFALMIPPVRRLIIGFVVRRATVRVHMARARHDGGTGQSPGGPVIDGEFEEVDPPSNGPARTDPPRDAADRLPPKPSP